MTKSFIRIGIVAGSAALVALVSCSTFQFPRGECHPEELVDGPNPSYVDRSNCARCLELQCCDDVGHCIENQAGCAEPFRLVLRKIQADHAFELRYLDELQEQPRNLYRCLRKDCAKECQVPSCDLSPAVTQLGNASCDQCITASCCEQINSCYENRRCKLALECIVTRCGKQLGESLDELDKHPEEREAFTQRFCSANPDLFDAGGGAKNCLDQCLEDYTTGDREDPEARCAAAGTYACAAKARCGNSCRPDAAADPPVDPPDSSADAPADSPADAPDG